MKKNFICFVVIFSMVLSSVMPSILAYSDEETVLDSSSTDDSGKQFLGFPLPPDANIKDIIFLFPFYVLRNVLGTNFYVLRFEEPHTFIAEPNVIDIQFLEQTTITIAGIDDDTGEYISLMDESLFPRDSLFISQDFEFSLEIPDYLPKDTFIPHFKPQNLETMQDGELETELKITSNILKDIALPENIILRVNVTKYQTFGNLFLPAKGHRLSPITISWFIASISGSNPFGKLYSGKRILESTRYVDIIVKLNRFHLVEIKPVSSTTMGPDELKMIPIEIENLGSHIDSYNFQINNNSDKDLIISPPPAITLDPGETKTTYIGIASPHLFNDPGTARKINLEAYSIYDPYTIFNENITIITRGVFVSPIIIFYTGIIAIPICLVAIIFYFNQRRKLEKFFRKPEKSWNIPAEKKYLSELKEKDKEEYNKIRQMMKDEYESALLWYNNYREDMGKESDSKGGFLSDFFKKLAKDKKTAKQVAKEPLKKAEKTKKEKKTKSGLSGTKIESASKEEKNRFTTFLGKLVKKEKIKTTEEKPKEKEPKERKSKDQKKEEKRKKTVQLPIKKKSRKEKDLLKINRKQEKQRKKFRNKVSWVKKTQ